jgi:hypothetical protein
MAQVAAVLFDATLDQGPHKKNYTAPALGKNLAVSTMDIDRPNVSLLSKTANMCEPSPTYINSIDDEDRWGMSPLIKQPTEVVDAKIVSTDHNHVTTSEPAEFDATNDSEGHQMPAREYRDDTLDTPIAAKSKTRYAPSTTKVASTLSACELHSPSSFSYNSSNVYGTNWAAERCGQSSTRRGPSSSRQTCGGSSDQKPIVNTFLYMKFA